MADEGLYRAGAPDEEPEEALSGKPPWKPGWFVAVSFLFSFAAAGIMAGINWHRLGEPRKVWPTIIGSILGLVGWIFVFVLVPIPDPASQIIGYIGNVGIAIMLAQWQKRSYEKWLATHGDYSSPGCVIPTLVGIGVIAISIAILVYGPRVLPSSRAIVHYNTGTEFLQDRDYERAEEEFTKAIGLDSNLANAYLNRGIVFALQGTFDEAKHDLETARELDPANALVYLNLGRLYMMQFRPSKALTELDKAIEIDGRLPEAYFFRGLVYDFYGGKEQSVKDLEISLEIGLDSEASKIAEELLESYRSLQD